MERFDVQMLMSAQNLLRDSELYIELALVSEIVCYLALCAGSSFERPCGYGKISIILISWVTRKLSIF